MNRVLLAAALSAWWAQAVFAESVKIGLVVTLSGPSAALGRHARDGFLLGLKQSGGKLGDQAFELTVLDDARDPQAVGPLVQGYVKAAQPAFVIGPLFANLLGPALKAATDGKAMMISPHAGPSALAGKRCQPNFFSLAAQNDQAIEVLAKYAEDRNLSRAIIVSTAGEEADTAVTAFTRAFKGEVADRIVISPDATDFGDLTTRIDVLRPQAVFLHVDGAVSGRLLAQISQSGAATGLTLLGSSGFDEAELSAHQGASVGVFTAGPWAYGQAGKASEAFVKAFETEYGYAPGTVAMQAFDAAHLIDGAVRLVRGDLSDKAVLADAMKQVDIDSPRGKLSFANNNFPIQDLYLTQIEKRGDGQVGTAVIRQMFAQYGDHYAAECPLK